MGRVLWTGAVVLLLASFLQPPTAGAARAEGALLDSVNAAREARGLAPVRTAPSLVRSSRRYSRWQLRHGYFGHQPSIWMSRRFSLRAEVLRLVPSWRVRPSRTVEMWLSSPSHAAAILHPAVRYGGAAIARGRFHGRLASVVTMHLAAR